MRRRPTLRDILRQTLIGSPLALAMLGGSSCGGGPCGTHVVIVNATPKPVDGGIDCSPCGEYGAINCNPVTVVSGTSSTTEVACNVYDNCPGGRRPSTLLAAHCRPAPGSAGAFFASAARLEAASVVAFRILARELEAHRAPRELITWCLRSAREEVTHARLTSSLARRQGAAPERPTYTDAPDVRPLEALALENAIEGCARESFGVVMAAWQARHSTDPFVADAMFLIARDELRHAELGWAIAEWAAPRLTRTGRSRVSEACAKAASELVASESCSPEETHVAGMPPAERHADLVARFRAALPV